MRMKKQMITILLTAMFALALIGCGATTGGANTGADSVQNGTTDNSQSGDSQLDTSSDAEGESESDALKWMYRNAVTVDDALQVVAGLNSCSVDELNYCLDQNGYVNFLGANFTDKQVHSADDASECIDDLLLLAGAENCEYVFYREDVSPVSGYTYYVFSQVASSEIDDLLISYSNAQVCIIANAAGNVVGYSAYVSPADELEKIDASNFVDQTEAEELVKGELTDGSSIFSDMTELTYWDDLQTVGNITDGRVAPVWLIYTNEFSEGKPYTMYLVYARRVDDEAVIMDKVATSTLNAVSDEYTSEIFFMDMEDAGYVDYTIDMEWAINADNGYVAGDTLQVSVPIMYSPSQELYYLADYNERIAVANCYDFQNRQEINTLVTENPSDLYSWRFLSMEGPEGQKYFCNPEYVIAAYDTMEKAFHIYKERYGYTSVDTSGMPILLLTYLQDGEYPEEEADMVQNANSIGQWHDWAVFGTSPTYTGCVEVGTMTHEFAHGINGQLTTYQYINEMGAVMEGYADSIGEYLALMYGYKDEAYKDLIGSEFCSPIRSFSNPYEFQSAKYIGGTYYVSPVDEVLRADFDYGGVHSNSSVVNYLAYCLCHNENPDVSILTMGQTVDLFLETLYCANYTTGYNELGSYLVFAADSMDLDDATYTYVYDTVHDLGFTGDYSVLEQLIAEEKAVSYQFSLFVSEDNVDAMEDFSFGIWLENYDTDTYYNAGMVDENGSLTFYLPEQENCDALIYVGSKKENKLVGYAYVEDIVPDANNVIPITYDELDVDDVIDFEKTIDSISYYDLMDENADFMDIEYDYEDTSYCFDMSGLYCVSLMDEEGKFEIIILIVE